MAGWTVARTGRTRSTSPGSGWSHTRSGPARRPYPGQDSFQVRVRWKESPWEARICRSRSRPMTTGRRCCRPDTGELAHAPVRDGQAQLLRARGGRRDNELDVLVTDQAGTASAHEGSKRPALVAQSDRYYLFLITLLSGIFLKGFKEAIGIAVVLVGSYLLLNVIVIGFGLYHIARHPAVITDWQQALIHHPRVGGNWTMILFVGLLVFPKLALGLSGFETGVAVMPLVSGDAGDTEEEPRGRIRNTKKLLLVAALIMSVMLVSSSFVTTLLIPADKFRPAAGGLPQERRQDEPAHRAHEHPAASSEPV